MQNPKSVFINPEGQAANVISKQKQDNINIVIINILFLTFIMDY